MMKISKSELKTIFTGEHIAVASGELNEEEIIKANVERKIESDDSRESE